MFLSIVQRALTPFDAVRFVLLRWTMRFALLRRLYLVRAHRLLFQHTLAAILYFSLALKFPIFLLFAGPLIYGVPHIFATARYVPRLIVGRSHQHLSVFVLLMSFAIFAFILFGLKLSDYKISISELNLVALVVSSFIFIKLLSKNLSAYSKVMALFGAGSVSLAMFFYPLISASVLMLAHNFVAYIYWYFGARKPAEHRAALLSLALFAAVHLLIFCGVFDSWFGWGQPNSMLSRWLGLDMNSIGVQLVSPFTFDFLMFKRAVVAFAFGQSMHYFVWLKAIPEHHLRNQLPTTFKQSLILFVNEMGKPTLIIALLLMTVYIGLHFWMPATMVRNMYLSLASYHGFAEIAALFLLFRKSVGIS